MGDDSGDPCEGADAAIFKPSAHDFQESPAHDLDARAAAGGFNLRLASGIDFLEYFNLLHQTALCESYVFTSGGPNGALSLIPPNTFSAPQDYALFGSSQPAGGAPGDANNLNQRGKILGTIDFAGNSNVPNPTPDPPTIILRYRYPVRSGQYVMHNDGYFPNTTSKCFAQLISEDLTQTVNLTTMVGAFVRVGNGATFVFNGTNIAYPDTAIMFGRKTNFYPQLVFQQVGQAANGLGTHFPPDQPWVFNFATLPSQSAPGPNYPF